MKYTYAKESVNNNVWNSLESASPKPLFAEKLEYNVNQLKGEFSLTSAVPTEVLSIFFLLSVCVR